MTGPQDTSTARGEGSRPADPAWTMSLINNLMRAPLDPGYAAAARKREAAGGPAATGLKSPLLIVAMLVIGLGLAVAAHALRVPAGVADKERTNLIGSIESRQKQIDTDTRKINDTQSEINRLQAQALSRQNDASLADRLRKLETQTGGGAVTGPGLTLTVDDAPGAGTDAQGNPRTDSSTGRLTSTDLQIVVNGLWQAGAEAISINGQRLTSQSAIRFAGQAILVNFRALTPPYTISVIGGPGVADAFRSDSGGAYLRGLVDDYQIKEKLTTSSSVSLPAAATPALAYAHPPAGTTSSAASSAAPTSPASPSPSRSTQGAPRP
ncbi:DUF881 domain-containing protein [Flexivirga sp. ID2601S]|uniref:DUF881 domain-containing protein n=1 Tax=Flexivirga aerilata TaxID=1656889 RepID=A0A849AKK4_9MICO|nr:DUF881 domain-containing protein [Flexivirga aerilata]NNG40899.1 DUF881 domain-containing protein [Flexivirga aerilata]